MKLSLAIPVYNEEESILRTLTHIYTTNGDFDLEVNICLNACTDKSEEIIRKFKKKNKGYIINIYKEPNKGKAFALRKLDRMINNDIIIFTDADSKAIKNAISILYERLHNASSKILIASGNSVDPRYINKRQKSSNLIESLNRIFWQRTGRKIINGQLFAARKGVISTYLPENVISEDTYLSVLLMNRFINVYNAQIITGSAQSIYEIIRYRKNFETAYRQIRRSFIQNEKTNLLPVFEKILEQFEIQIENKQKYWPNLNIVDVLIAKSLIIIAKIWAKFCKPSWNKTLSSKNLAE